MVEERRQPESEEASGPAPGAEAGPLEETMSDIDARVEEMMAGAVLPEELAVRVAEQEPADAADVIERLDRDEQAALVHHMADEAAAEALAHMELPLARTVLLDLAPKEAGAIIDLMDPDDAADVLQEIDRQKRQAILQMVPPRKAAILGKLALYDPETAGGIMTTEIGVVRAGLTIGQAIEFLKRHPISEGQNEVYCVDDQKRLVGTIGLRDILIVDDAHRVEDHMERDVDRVLPEVDREEVARMFERYDLLTLPVVDAEGRALGMITVDDVVDIIAAEATEDAYKQVGAGESEAVYSSVMDKLRGRTPWLMANLLMAQLGSAVLLIFTDLIEAIPVVAVVYPIIANQSGNSGHQSMAITLRGLVLGEVRRERVWPLVRREMAFGAITGLLIGMVFGIAAALLAPLVPTLAAYEIDWWWLGAASGLAMAGALTVSCLVGTGVPMLMDRLGFDPATASSIFVTMLTDAISYATFLVLVFAMRGLLTP